MKPFKEDFSDIHHLYKYRNFDDVLHLNTILNNEFYFSSKDKLNDPFEIKLEPDYEAENGDTIKIFVERIQKEKPRLYNENVILIEERKEDFINNPTLLANEQKRNFTNYFRKFGVCSFSGNVWNNILMWSHYLNNHTGFCVGINFNILEQLKVENKIEASAWITDYIDEYPASKPLTQHDSEDYRIYFASKYSEWKYENEIRLINEDPNSSSKFPDNVIDEIYIGLKTSKENEELIKNILKLKKSNIDLYKIIQKSRTFNLDREIINY